MLATGSQLLSKQQAASLLMKRKKSMITEILRLDFELNFKPMCLLFLNDVGIVLIAYAVLSFSQASLLSYNTSIPL
eukprot:scaffold87810_cov12-Tisochrysis_lutea.AAC.1